MKMWDGIMEMRKMHIAAVDTMGCEVQKKNDGYSKDDKAYHVLISLMLSA